MSYIPHRAGTLLIQSGPPHDPNRLHLHVICTDPCRFNTVIVVPVITIVAGVYHDPSCELDVGDHAFIKHPSYVFYTKSGTMHVKHLMLRVTSGDVKVSATLDSLVFSRVCAGLKSSRQTPRWIKDHYRQYP